MTVLKTVVATASSFSLFSRSSGLVLLSDRVTRSRYLPDRYVEAMDIAADGSVWLLAKDDLCVITSEALGASE